jgi:peptidoglycan hydrolase CwlO-like protein
VVYFELMTFRGSFSPAKLALSFALAMVLVGVGTTLHPSVIFAQTTDSTSADVAAKRAQLQAELNSLNSQIAQTSTTLTTLNGQGKTLQNQIDTLTAQIKKSQLQLRATQVQIQALQSNIVIHNDTIQNLSGKLSDEQNSLAQIIRQTNEIDNYSVVELMLSSDNVSSFFGDLDSFTTINQELNASYTQTTNTKSQKLTEKNQLVDQQSQQEQLQHEQSMEEAQIQTQQAAQKKLLAANKSQVVTETKVYNAQKESIATIQAELFALAGGSGQISLPAAIALAKQAGKATSVDPALILGILKQETNIGQNVGQCYLTNSPNKGDGINKNSGAAVDGLMKPTRDVDPFMSLTQTLGLDPYKQAVSCAPSYGYGGAMGPGQFIASTWVLYSSRIASMLGHAAPANPWNNLDAFTAVGLLMKDNGAPADLGATPGCPSAGCEAALRYFAGWGNADNPAYSFYGDGVMSFAAQFKSDINTLAGS